MVAGMEVCHCTTQLVKYYSQLIVIEVSLGGPINIQRVVSIGAKDDVLLWFVKKFSSLTQRLLIGIFTGLPQRLLEGIALISPPGGRPFISGIIALLWVGRVVRVVQVQLEEPQDHDDNENGAKL